MTHVWLLCLFGCDMSPTERANRRALVWPVSRLRMDVSHLNSKRVGRLIGAIFYLLIARLVWVSECKLYWIV